MKVNFKLITCHFSFCVDGYKHNSSLDKFTPSVKDFAISILDYQLSTSSSFMYMIIILFIMIKTSSCFKNGCGMTAYLYKARAENTYPNNAKQG